MSGLPAKLSAWSEQVALLSSELSTGPKFKAITGFTSGGTGL